MTADDEAVTFSGKGTGQFHPNPDVAIQPIDEVIFGKTHEVQRPVGSFRFMNPFHGKAPSIARRLPKSADLGVVQN